MSETKYIRETVLPYCVGKGLDLGCGGDKITPDCFGFDLPKPYTKVGDDIIEMWGDARCLPFNDDVLDYVYSSHLLEDFLNTKDVLCEWLRVVKPNGFLIIYCPDEQVYRNYCKETGQDYNLAHCVSDMSLPYMLDIISDMSVEVVYRDLLVNFYSFLLVLRKVG